MKMSDSTDSRNCLQSTGRYLCTPVVSIHAIFVFMIFLIITTFLNNEWPIKNAKDTNIFPSQLLCLRKCCRWWNVTISNQTQLFHHLPNCWLIPSWGFQAIPNLVEWTFQVREWDFKRTFFQGRVQIADILIRDHFIQLLNRKMKSCGQKIFK